MNKIPQILILLMLISLSQISIVHSLENGGYPYANAAKCGYGEKCEVDEWAMYKRQCTSYAAFKADQKIGNFHNAMVGPNGKKGLFGNGGNWDENAKLIGFEVSSSPKKHTVFSIPPFANGAGKVGHVGFVEEVLDSNKFKLSEYNWNGGDRSYNTRTATANSNYSFISFETNACKPPSNGDWIINNECNLSGAHIAKNNVRITKNGRLNLLPQSSLRIDFTSKQITLESGGKINISNSAKISK